MFHRRRASRSMRLHASSTPVVEALERRTLLSTFMVTNHRDVGPGSLRDAVQQSNNTPGPNTIEFAAGFTGTITLTGTQLEISGNLSITGPGASSLTISGGGLSRVFLIDAGATASISGLTITGGHTTDVSGAGAGANGGGIYNLGSLTLSDDLISRNVCGDGNQGAPGTPQNPYPSAGDPGGSGGGIYTSGTLTLIDSTVENNSGGAGGNGAGETAISGVSAGGDGGSGGGIYSAKGRVVLLASTIDNNTTGNHGRYGASLLGPGPSYPGGSGAGVYSAGQLVLANCTISGNTVGTSPPQNIPPYPPPSYGGASALDSSGTLQMTNSTISGNHANGSSDGAVKVAGSAIVNNTIIAGNNGDVSGNLDKSSSHDLIGTGSGLANGVNGNHVGVANPYLTPLSDNGGPTQTMLPQVGSLALDGGSIALAVGPDGQPLTTDQRGMPRTLNGTIDIGATEVGIASFPLVVTTTADKLDSYVPSNLSLREAIGLAGALGGPQTITFASSLSGTITLNASLGPLEFADTSGKLTLQGPGASTISVNAGASAINIDSGVNAEIDALRFSGSGAVSVLGTLTLDHCVIGQAIQTSQSLTVSNSTTGDINGGGSITVSNSNIHNVNGVGATITVSGSATRDLWNMNAGSLIVSNSTVNATKVGSAGTLSLTQSTVIGTGGSDSVGFPQNATLLNCTFSSVGIVNNSTAAVITNCTFTQGGSRSMYGIIFNGAGFGLTMTNCQINATQALAVNNAGSLTMSGCTISGGAGGTGEAGGGGMYNSGSGTLTDCTVFGNSIAGAGGGIYNDTAGTLSLTDCAVSGNSCTQSTPVGSAQTLRGM